MKIEVTSDEELLQQADRLLYEVLWQPFGLPEDTRSKFEVLGQEKVIAALDEDKVVGTIVIIIQGEAAEIRHVSKKGGYNMQCPWCDEEIPENVEVCPECGVELKSLFKAEEEKKRKRINCLRCDGVAESLGVEKIQLGQYGLLLGDLSNLLSGALEVEIFQCDRCGKIEFFAPKED